MKAGAISSVKSKILRISSLNIDASFIIKDPCDQTVNYFHRTYAQIKQLLDSPELL